MSLGIRVWGLKPAAAAPRRLPPPLHAPRAEHRAGPCALPAEAGNAPGATPGDTAPDARAAALLPMDLLQPGEVIILLLKPSAWFILLESLKTLTVLFVIWIAAALLTNYAGRGPSRRDLAVALFALAAMRLFWQFFEWLGRVYVLTDRRVIRIRGVIRVHIFETSLKHIQNTSTYFSLRERFFGLGTIGFGTAGTGPFEVYWRMIAHPLEVHRMVVQTLNRYR